jgi:2-oxo-4-hydroxy-4-carboxy--5-ureidoimidazoline (OHCU) decarboxylase
MQGYARQALLFQRSTQKFRIYRATVHIPAYNKLMSSSLPPASSLQSLPDEEVCQVLSLLFEPSPALHSLILPLIRSRSLPTYSDLAHATREALSSLSMDSTVLLDILSAHPRLGAKKVDSEQSQAEQKSLGNENELAELQRLNEEYEKKFPGLRYVVFVNGRSREEVMKDMKKRTEVGDREDEIVKAIDAMCDIAVDRARKMGAE